MSYLPLTENDRRMMNESLGIETTEALIEDIPQNLRNPRIALPAPLSEYEIMRLMRERAFKNACNENVLSFAGAGAYEHFSPSAVDHLLQRAEFYTAYTPYQAEASQGTLQAIYEYQSMMCALTGMDVSNASHYDGATSMAEAALLSLVTTGRKKILVARNLHPEYRQVLRTYIPSDSAIIQELAFNGEGTLDQKKLIDSLNSEVACVIVSVPNFFGIVEDLSCVREQTQSVGAQFIIVANPLSLARFKTPGEWGADIACGEAQVFGVPLSYGGPYLGYFATRKKLMRKVPGRLVGISHDLEKKRMFTLTLQAREQHIRRERATSNICSNQALCALAAAIHLALMGPQGLERVADRNIYNIRYLRDRLAEIPGCKIPFAGTLFNECVVCFDRDITEVLALLRKENIMGGVVLDAWYPELKNALLICATETKTQKDLDYFIAKLKKVMS